MLGTIIVVSFTQFILSYFMRLLDSLITIGLPAGSSFIPYAVAGILGALQFIRTEYRPMRLGERAYCAVTSILVIALVPAAISLVVGILNIVVIAPEAIWGLLNAVVYLYAMTLWFSLGNLVLAFIILVVAMTVTQRIKQRSSG